MYFARCDPKAKPQLTSTVAGSVVGPTVVVKCESLLLNRGEGFSILARALFEQPMSNKKLKMKQWKHVGTIKITVGQRGGEIVQLASDMAR